MKNDNMPEICFACEEGRYEWVVEDYRRQFSGEESIVVPQLVLFRCDKCGETTIPPESSRRIEAAIEKHEDTLPAAAVRSFLEIFGIDQSEAAEALGLGSKTIHRWAKGTQRVSRSMGYFLRGMMAYPEAFQWIKERGWRHDEAKTSQSISAQLGVDWSADYQSRFPASGGQLPKCRASETPAVTGKRFNAAKGLVVAAIS